VHGLPQDLRPDEKSAHHPPSRYRILSQQADGTHEISAGQ
jgi:hypothetical protein